MGASAVVATTIPLAVGYAFAQRQLGKSTVVACFLGDGAVEEGVFHESLNFAALKKVPLLFVCENNGYAIHSHQRSRQARGDVCALARAHGLAAERFKEMDVERIHRRTRDVLEDMRAGRGGPYLFECRCYRWREHVGPNLDFDSGYRRREDCDPWQEADPLRRLAAHIDPDERWRIERDIESEIQSAIDFAEASPFPDDAELVTDLYRGDVWNG
jgi:TPP-dependent pyruvate/acetoin dehydrogenase alpha subunit